MRQVRTHYPTEFKIKAVELVNQNDNAQAVANDLGVNRETLRLWQKLYREGKLTIDPNAPQKLRSKEDEELSRLKKELYEVTLERDILKKAVGIFSKSGR